MTMVKPSPRSPLADTNGNNKDGFLLTLLTDDSVSEPMWDETFVKDRYLPLVYAEEILVPLPGVPFLACKHIE